MSGELAFGTASEAGEQMNDPAKQITLLRVRGLLGEYTHEVPVPSESLFSIIYGPNGVGKTKFFQAIAALANLDLQALSSLPLKAVGITFADERELVGTRIRSDARTSEVMLSIQKNGHVLQEWLSDYKDVQPGATTDGLSTWRPYRGNLWRDEIDGEIVSREELEERYGALPVTPSIPEEYVELATRVPVTLIETQRLSVDIQGGGRNRNIRVHRPAAGGRFPRDEGNAAVTRYSVEIRDVLRQLLASNSRTTQALDRTFPSRLLSATPAVALTEEQIRARYADLNSRRQRLAEISLIQSEDDVPLPSQKLEDWQRNVLSTYLKDSEQKLAGFQETVAKIDILEEIVNQRFLRKELNVNAESGLTFSTSHGSRIAPSDLSSGEQHELILIYTLLFKVPIGSLVLIDEPEISLHITWQRRFLDDVARIAVVAGFRFVVATHSPAIIGPRGDVAYSLAPGFDE